MTGHNAGRLNAAVEGVRKDIPSANLRPLLVDFSSFASARKAAEEVISWAEPLHVLIHNAAAPIGPFVLTTDNLETQMAVGHLVPFLFTALIKPIILSSASPTYTPRVIFISSIGHGHGTGPNFATLGKPDETLYQPVEAYYRVKSANVLTALEICKRSEGRVNAYSLHPGAIYTNIMQHPGAIGPLQEIGLLDSEGGMNTDPAGGVHTPGGIPWKTIAQGAATTIVAAFDPSLNDKPGTYLNDCAPANDIVGKESRDMGNATRLWRMSEKIVGENFVF
ncbi:hypothetical protein FB45DRAFT_1021413 [Roridomyces roridus]|uniref:Uncharacterized protein n=1 Tax=Roridomyces roridus TaxID=1738132 RepID=A0AAD7CBZ3_9AGAR|nr:hypothetical protein FB45DRAFT_1021413 [Roridomyces roridus]